MNQIVAALRLTGILTLVLFFAFRIMHYQVMATVCIVSAMISYAIAFFLQVYRVNFRKYEDDES